MTECTNDGMRDLLPLLAHGSLGAGEAEAVRAHAAACASCGAELAALETTRLVLRAQAPKVDVTAIARAVTAATRPAAAPVPTLRVERGGATAPSMARRAPWRSRQWLAAAASVLVVVSLSLPMLGRGGEEGAGVTIPTAPAVVAPVDSPVAPVAPAAAGGSVTVGQTLGDLSADDLSALLSELEALEATIATEPTTMRQPIVDTPEVL